MPETFHCPSCNARLTYTEDMPEVVSCEYCGTSVVVPESLRKPDEPTSSFSGGTFVMTSTDTTSQPDASARGCAIFLAVVLMAGIGLLVAFVGSGVTGEQISAQISGIVLPGGENGVARDSENPLGAGLLSADPILLQIGTGEEGTGVGRFEDLRHVALDGEGNIYAAEHQSERIQVFSPDGEFLTQWNLPDDAPIRAMDVARDGTVYLVQGFTVSLYRDGEPVGTVPDLATFDTVTTLPQGGIILADDDNIFQLDASDTLVLELPEAISERADTPELGPQIAVTGRGDIVYLSANNSSVFVFDANGVFQTRITDEERIRAASDVAVDGDGNIYVSAIFGVHVYSPEGQYIDSVSVEPGSPYFGLAIDEADRLYIASRTRLIVLDVSGF